MVKRHFKMGSVVCLLGTLAICICHGEEQQTEEPAEEQVQESVGEVETYDRSRYDVIVERSPFGADPLVDEENRKEVAAAKALEKDYRLCFLLESESGEVRAGFQNKKAKKGEPKSVMLMVGESHGSMKLLDIDLENSSATLQYQGREITFELAKPKAGATKPNVPAATPNRPQRRFGGGFRRTTPEEPQPEPEPQPSSEEVEAQQAAVRETLQDYQMEVIRQGMPPLPVQLTKERDDQLVAEGFLPPIEEEQ